MKYTLRQQLLNMLTDLIDRQKQLDKNVKEYADAGNYSDASINQIKKDTITLVISRIEEILTH